MEASLVGRPGLVVAGRYHLEQLLGRGAMGEVWRARHTSLDSRLAIKLVAMADRSTETVHRLLVEAKAAAAIVSPYVVRIYDHGREGAVSYIAMELLEGETLAARLRRKRRLAPAETAIIMRHVAQGIAQAHALGIVHRDLKPENVFLAQTEQGEVAKVLDFGIAKSELSSGTMTQTGVVVGTPAYLSREQVLGTHAVDLRADLWAMGIVTYECLTGTLPYRASTMAELFAQIVGSTLASAARNTDLPPGFADWFLRATHPDPSQRFASARELADELTKSLAPDLSLAPWAVNVGPEGRPVSMIPVPIDWPQKKRPVVTYAMLGGLAAMAGLLVILTVREVTRPPAPKAATLQGSSPIIDSVSSPQEAPPAPAVTATAPPVVEPAASTAPSASAAASVSAPAPASAAPSASSPRPAAKRPVERWGL
ncbi:MAG: serine/threonine protein kinase [Polyangiaceae bacterium]|nr:serine/threonine protein kinase [Polyangiaceae bacterium]